MKKTMYLVLGKPGIGKSFLAEKVGKEFPIGDLRDIVNIPRLGPMFEEGIFPVLTSNLEDVDNTIIALSKLLASDCQAELIVIHMSN